MDIHGRILSCVCNVSEPPAAKLCLQRSAEADRRRRLRAKYGGCIRRALCATPHSAGNHLASHRAHLSRNLTSPEEEGELRAAARVKRNQAMDIAQRALVSTWVALAVW